LREQPFEIVSRAVDHEMIMTSFVPSTFKDGNNTNRASKSNVSVSVHPFVQQVQKMPEILRSQFIRQPRYLRSVGRFNLHSLLHC
jgi:hypothetical protein